MSSNPFLSDTAISNLYTMSIFSEVDARQRIPETQEMPSVGERLLRMNIDAQECLFELAAAMGFTLIDKVTGLPITAKSSEFVPSHEPNMEDLIDALGDGIYVLTGTLVKCGVPDLPHLAAICDANDAKFPNGQGVPGNIPGKFGKPPGWQAPNHAMVTAGLPPLNLAAAARQIRAARR